MLLNDQDSTDANRGRTGELARGPAESGLHASTSTAMLGIWRQRFKQHKDGCAHRLRRVSLYTRSRQSRSLFGPCGILVVHSGPSSLPSKEDVQGRIYDTSGRCSGVAVTRAVKSYLCVLTTMEKSHNLDLRT